MWQSMTTSLFLPRPSHDKKTESTRRATFDKLTEAYRTKTTEKLKKILDPVTGSSDALTRALDDICKLACYVGATFVTQRCGLEVFEPFAAQREEGAEKRQFDKAVHEPWRDP